VSDQTPQHRPEFDELAAMVVTLDAVEYQTPFLAVDLDAMERNLARMAEYFAQRPAALRPHLKHHKCTEIARMQLDAGARGITCATSDELAAAVRAGISDVLVANVVTDRARLASIAHSASRADVTIAADSEPSARLASDAATAAGATLRVLIEYDVGMRRSGVDAITEALELAELVTRLPGLGFRGIQAYEGHLVGIADRAERKARVTEAFAPMPEVLRELGDHGYEVEMFSGGSASTYDVSGKPAVHDRRAGRLVRPDGRDVRSIGARVRAGPGGRLDGGDGTPWSTGCPRRRSEAHGDRLGPAGPRRLRRLVVRELGGALSLRRVRAVAAGGGRARSGDPWTRMLHDRHAWDDRRLPQWPR
jgi:hypothetical protein